MKSDILKGTGVYSSKSRTTPNGLILFLFLFIFAFPVKAITYEDMLQQALFECMDRIEQRKTTFQDYSLSLEAYQKYQNEYYTMSITNNKEVQELAKMLKRNTVEDTIDAVDYWITANIKYEVFYYQRDIKQLMLEKSGDCTDASELYYQLLGYNGIVVKKVHGFKAEKHDWVEVLYPVDNWLYWKPINGGDEKSGNGFW